MRSRSRDRGAYHPSVVVSADNGSRNPLSTNSVQGRGYLTLRVHHQRRVEPYTLGRGGRRAVGIAFIQAKYSCTKTTTNTTRMHNTHVPTNERTHAQCSQYIRRDRLLPNQYTQHTLTMVTATDQYTATTLTPVRRGCTIPHPCPHWPRMAGPIIYSNSYAPFYQS